ncbi:MAG: hypothetical protein JXR13_12610 [Thalassovita sp.]
MRFLILLAWGICATAASSQTTPQAPVTEQVTVTVYGPWTHGFRTSDTAEAHLREHPYVYVNSAATAVGSEMDGRPISSKLVSIEFKSKGDASHFPFKARAKVEVTLVPWSTKIPKEVGKAEAAAEANGEKPIENELDQRLAELEALDEDASNAVVDKLTSDMLNKINDIDVMRNTLVSVITRMKSKGPAMGLWKGGNTAHRYVSRLEEMAARVQHFKDSLTGLQDHANGTTTSLIDGLLDDLEALETDVGQSLYRNPDSTHVNDPDRIAYWDARDAFKQSLHDARNHAAIDYDMGMQGERYARSARGFERNRKSKEWQEQAARDAVAGNADDETADEGDTAALRASLREGSDKDRLKAALVPNVGETGGTTEPDQSPMRRVKPEGGTSPLRSAAGDDSGSDIRRHAGADGPRTMDADGGDIQMSRETGETAPRVETPRLTSPFDLARQGKEREEQQQKAQEAMIRFQNFQENMLEQAISQIGSSGKNVRLVLSERGFASPEVESTCTQIERHLQTTAATEIRELTSEVSGFLCIPSYDACVSNGGYWECSPDMVAPESCGFASQELGLSEIRSKLSSCFNLIVKIEDAINGIQSGKNRNYVSACFGTNSTEDLDWLEMFANGSAGAGGDYTLALKQERVKVKTQVVPIVNHGLSEIANHCREMAEKPRAPIGSVAVFLENETSVHSLQTAVSQHIGDGFSINVQLGQIGGVDTPEMVAFARSQGLELLSESRIKELKEEIEWLKSRRP